MFGTPSWWPRWSGEDVMIVASGPTAVSSPVELGRNCVRTIAINSSIDLAPWADALYACDGGWWESRDGCPDYDGLKITAARKAAEKYDLALVDCSTRVNEILLRRRGEVGWGRNSGFQALNLALQMRPFRIFLVGYDMHVRSGQNWHPDHNLGNSPKKPENMKKWAQMVDSAKPHADRLGVKVYNCSPDSDLKAFPRVGLEEALCCLS